MIAGMSHVSIANPTFEYDPTDPDGFRSGMARLGPQLGARRTGTTVYELPPGQALCPYHYEHGEEEWVLVLAGNPTLRTPEGSERLEPLDLAFFATGPAGAHQVRNDTDAPVRLLMWSEVVWPTATTYPDSDKVGVFVGEGQSHLFRRTSAVDYFDGETSAEAPG
jgi:uncharacterized cupin superfamily protein